MNHPSTIAVLFALASSLSAQVSEDKSRYSCHKPDSVISATSSAVRCAESFIAAQGYTLAPPAVDSASIEYELFDSGYWRDVLRHRKGSLAPKAVGLCLDNRTYDVAFEQPGDSSHRVGRAVRIRLDFTEVRMVHQLFNLNALDGGFVSCHRLHAE